ncbi:MAG: DUF2271 domain-containing protein [Treponema sp.]|jgi:hypothetical protein|nr:DUF2271 domain-containing protein [Treponema sp.]
MRIIGLTLSLIIGASIFYCSCTTGETKEPTSDIQTNMELAVEPGENWFRKMRVFLFILRKSSPQLAAWIEDNNGNYLSTITVSEKSVKENWISAPKEGRPEALPVWSYRQQHYSVTNDVDTMSSATKKGSFEANIDRESLVNGNTYNVFLEINHSFDYNDYWTKDNSGVNGQPSLVYHAQFIAGQSGHISLVPIGHGSVNGSDGNIVRELESIISALSIVRNASITIK